MLRRGFSLKCYYFRVGEVSYSGRIYPRELFERELERFRLEIEQDKAFGCLGSPPDGKTRISEASHLIEGVSIGVDGRVEAAIKPLDNPYGRSLRQMVERNFKLTLALRGFGSVDGAGVVQPDYRLVAFDITERPADIYSLPSEQSTPCNCTSRDLLTFGHRCGRKAPIDR